MKDLRTAFSPKLPPIPASSGRMPSASESYAPAIIGA